jgi:hypothetical protein
MGSERREARYSAADRIERLRGEHEELERRLAALDDHVYLTPDEQLERRRIQKLKLQKKDQLHALRQAADAD